MSPPAPSHVLMTADTIGGVWTFVLELCRVLGKRKIKVTLVTMGRPPEESQSREIRALSNVRFVPTEYRLEWMDCCESDLESSGRFLLALAEAVKPDLVHCNTYYHASLPFNAPVLLTAHSCISSWWVACKQEPVPDKWKHYEQIITRAIRAADLLIAPTAAYLDLFCLLHGNPRHARVIWNGSDVRQIPTTQKEHFVFSAGRLWDEAKNVSLLCKAALEAGVPLMLGGDQTSPAGSKAEFPGVTVLGRLTREQMHDWMSRALICASPARYEPFGLTILEAAHCGCALVLSDIPTLRELWEGAAIFPHANDLAEWQEVLSYLFAHPEIATAVGEEARARARRYSADAMGAAYVSAYEAVLSHAISKTGVAA